MSFWVIITPMLILSIHEAIYLRDVTRHDTILFEFCDLRRKLMGFLRENGFDLKPEDYEIARELLFILNHTIHYYNDHKTGYFNGRKFLHFLRQYLEATNKIKSVKQSSIPTLNYMRMEYNLAMLDAFKAYTPFFVLHFAVMVFGVAFKLNARRFKRHYRLFQAAKDRIYEQQQCVNSV